MTTSNATPRVLVIIPAYNEAANIGEVVRDVRTHVPEADVTVVDDGSTDQTAAEAARAGARVLRLPYNLGIGGAMQTGFRMAVDQGYDAAIQVDGDGQHRADEIVKLMQPVLAGEVDVAIGTRYRDARGYATPAGRRLGQRFFAGLVRLLTGQMFTDTTSGFRAYGRAALPFLATHYSRDYPEVNAIVALSHNGFRIREYPVAMRSRSRGSSHINVWRAIYYMCKVPLSAVITAARRRERASR